MLSIEKSKDWGDQTTHFGCSDQKIGYDIVFVNTESFWDSLFCLMMNFIMLISLNWVSIDTKHWFGSNQSVAMIQLIELLWFNSFNLISWIDWVNSVNLNQLIHLSLLICCNWCSLFETIDSNYTEIMIQLIS